MNKVQEKQLRDIIKKNLLESYIQKLSSNPLVNLADEIRGEIGGDLFVSELIKNLNPDSLKNALLKIAQQHSINTQEKNPFDLESGNETENDYGSLWNSIKNYKP